MNIQKDEWKRIILTIPDTYMYEAYFNIMKPLRIFKV